MGPREEDNDMLLLVVVSLICATLVSILEFGSTKPAVAAKLNPCCQRRAGARHLAVQAQHDTERALASS